MNRSFNKSAAALQRAEKVLVGGVNSPVRAFASVGGQPLFISHASGPFIYDVDGNEYIDLVLSYGPMILGHGYPQVRKAVAAAVELGFSYGATAEKEIYLAELITGAFPTIDKIRFVNSGTEAVLSAIRLARAYTGRDKIIKFSGCYHGHMDALLVAAGSGLATLSLPASKGVPQAAVGNTLVAEYNNIDTVAELFSQHDDIAAVILEPVAGNMGVVVPTAEFLQGLAALAADHGALIIVDEVMTGFRAKFGGTQDLVGIKADITCLGKVIGGGFPVGAYGARAEIMDMVAPLGEVYQAGTLSGNPVAMAAGLATLTELQKQNPYQQFTGRTTSLAETMKAAADEAGIPVTVNAFGSMINPFFTAGEVTDFKSAQASDTRLFGKFFWQMIKNGVFLPPSQFESWFLSTALLEVEFERLEKIVYQSIINLKK